MKYRLTIFDFDGTLVDTATDVAHCFNDALEAHGFPACEFKTISSLIGKPLEHIVSGLLEDGCARIGLTYSDADIKRVAETYKQAYAANPKANTQPFDGMEKLINALQAAGIAVGVNSNKPEPALASLAQRCFPGQFFQIVGYVSGKPVKPDPAGALQLVKAAGVSVQDAIYIGDTQIDYDTAHNANMDCAIVTWGQGAPELYRQPDLIACCDTVEQLRSTLLG